MKEEEKRSVKSVTPKRKLSNYLMGLLRVVKAQSVNRNPVRRTFLLRLFFPQSAIGVGDILNIHDVS